MPKKRNNLRRIKGAITRRTFVGASAASAAALFVTRRSPGVTSTSTQFRPSREAIPQRSPLGQVPFLPLPLGAVRARGWLQTQLELQRSGLTGHADEILPGLDHATSAWLNPQLAKGEDWEKGPYYAKGLVPLAFTLDDDELKQKAMIWVEALLASQRADGFYGPRNDDWWPRMVVNYMLRDYFEATADERIPPFLSRYYAYLQQELPKRPLKEWGKARAGDEIDTIVWLYNRTGEDSLLRLTDLLYAQAYPWREIFADNRFLHYPADFHPKHAVNVAQALKAPVVYWQRSQLQADRDSFQTALGHLAADHGTTFGINTGTEFLSGRSSVEGVELCAIAEKMLTCETAMRILGDAAIGDELELLAFNALPAALSKPFRQHVYYTLANNVSARMGSVGYEIDYADARTPAPRSGCPCCCYNLHMAWPKLTQNAWAAIPTGGLAILAYVPSEVSAQVRGGQQVRIVCDTNYPFEESISLTVHVAEPSQFPLHLRIPAWCKEPTVTVNGDRYAELRPGRFTVIDRSWSQGDKVEISFPMPLSTVRTANNAVSVRRGPLVYALAMKEEWKVIDKGRNSGFESYEVTSPTPWNFALDIDEAAPAATIEVIRNQFKKNPFETGNPPSTLKAKARKIDSWKLRADGLVPLDPPVSPVASEHESETIELVPFGSQMLRITNFPVFGTYQEHSRSWKDRFAKESLDDLLIYRGGFLRDGRLHLVKGAKAIVENIQCKDLQYSATVRVGDAGDAGIIFRVTEPSIGIDHYKGYYVGIEPSANSVVVGKSDNRWIPIARQPAPISAGKDHHLRVEAGGSEIRVWLDHNAEPLISIHDKSFAEGMIGVRSFANAVAFGQLSVDEITT